MLERRVPIWSVLLLLLVFGMFTVAFGWAILSTSSGSSRSGAFGEAAVAVAKFPTLVRRVGVELSRRASNEPMDHVIRVRRHQMNEDGFEPVASVGDASFEGLVLRAARERMAEGWRILVGTFSVEDDFIHAAILLSPELRVVHHWRLDEEDIGEREAPSPGRKFPHGFEILPDGSIVFAFDRGVSLQRVGRCGDVIWREGGLYHHSVALSEDRSSVWALRHGPAADAPTDALVEVAIEDGEILREIFFDEIVAANPDIGLLEIRRKHETDPLGNGRGLSASWLKDPFHANDVEPLPASLAGAYPDFEAGDLLISLRSLNLIFVLDPSTRRIKWWRAGAWIRQHDPDWSASGEIRVFDNRKNRDFSRIVAIDPETYELRTLVEGAPLDFYTRVRGKHQEIPEGHILVTSSQQHRVFEVDQDGAIVFEALSLKADDEAFGYTLSQAIWLPVEALPDGRDLGRQCDDRVKLASSP